MPRLRASSLFRTLIASCMSCLYLKHMPIRIVPFSWVFRTVKSVRPGDAQYSKLPYPRKEQPRAMFTSMTNCLAMERSNLKHAEDSLTTIWISKECESTFASTVKPESSWEFGEDNLSDPRHYSDDELIIAAHKGASRALGELLTRHRSFLFRMVRRMTATIEEAEDVVQDAMLRACVNIGKFRRESRFSTSLIVIATNSLLSARKKSHPTQWIYLDDTETASYHSNDLRDLRPTAEQECAGREFLESALREIQKLPRPYRSVLQARALHEPSVANTARDLGITKAMFNTRLRRGRAQLSQALGRTRVDKSVFGGARREM